MTFMKVQVIVPVAGTIIHSFTYVSVAYFTQQYSAFGIMQEIIGHALESAFARKIECKFHCLQGYFVQIIVQFPAAGSAEVAIAVAAGKTKCAVANYRDPDVVFIVVQKLLKVGIILLQLIL